MWQSKGTGKAGAVAGFTRIPESHPQPRQSRSSCALFKMGSCIGSHDAHLSSNPPLRTQVADKEDGSWRPAVAMETVSTKKKKVGHRDTGSPCNSDISSNVTATRCFLNAFPCPETHSTFIWSTSKGYFIPPHFKRPLPPC